jgi:hypothetical protein
MEKNERGSLEEITDIKLSERNEMEKDVGKRQREQRREGQEQYSGSHEIFWSLRHLLFTSLAFLNESESTFALRVLSTEMFVLFRRSSARG